MPLPTRVPARVLRALTGLLATALLIGWAASPAHAGVAGDHHSSTVVTSAASALAARDTLAADPTAATLAAYIAARDATADAVAVEMVLEPTDVRDAWSRADLPHQTAVLAALTELGKPYRYATSDPERGFDCSGLTAYAWARAGVGIPHQSSAQIRAAAPRDDTSAMAGDIVQYPGHVMLYLGVGDAIVHAANKRDDVELDFFGRSVRFGDPMG